MSSLSFAPVRAISTGSFRWQPGSYGEPPLVLTVRTSASMATVTGGEVINLAVAHLPGVTTILAATDQDATSISNKINTTMNAAYGYVGLVFASALSSNTIRIVDPISGSMIELSGSTQNDFEKIGFQNVKLDALDSSSFGTPLMGAAIGAHQLMFSQGVPIPSGSSRVAIVVKGTSYDSITGSTLVVAPSWEIAGFGKPVMGSSGSYAFTDFGSALVPGVFSGSLIIGETLRGQYLVGDPDLAILEVIKNTSNLRSFEVPIPLGAEKVRFTALDVTSVQTRNRPAITASVVFGWRLDPLVDQPHIWTSNV